VFDKKRKREGKEEVKKWLNHSEKETLHLSR